MTLKANIRLYDKETETNTYFESEEILNKNCISFLDDNKLNTEFCIYDDGIIMIRDGIDYQLELNLKDKHCIRITSSEGVLNLGCEMLAFKKNDDIVSVAYCIDNQEKLIEIKYTGEL